VRLLGKSSGTDANRLIGARVHVAQEGAQNSVKKRVHFGTRRSRHWHIVGRFWAKIHIAMILRAVNKSRGVSTEVMAGGCVKYLGAAFTTAACLAPARLLHSSLLRPLDSLTFQQQWPTTDVPFASLFRILKGFLRTIRYLENITHPRR
jgi:hypothetical protein